MTNSLPIPEEFWSKVLPDAQAALAAIFLAMQRRINDLEARFRDRGARLKLNSTNSPQPLSVTPSA